MLLITIELYAPSYYSGHNPGRPGVATFLPLNYHWSTLLHMEVVRSVAPILHFFMLILHFVSSFWRFQHFLTLHCKEVPWSVGTSNTLPPLLIHSCSIWVIHSSRISELLWHSITRKCQRVFSLLLHSCTFSTLPTKTGLQHARHPTRNCVCTSNTLPTLLIHSCSVWVMCGKCEGVFSLLYTPAL